MKRVAAADDVDVVVATLRRTEEEEEGSRSGRKTGGGRRRNRSGKSGRRPPACFSAAAAASLLVLAPDASRAWTPSSALPRRARRARSTSPPFASASVSPSPPLRATAAPPSTPVPASNDVEVVVAKTGGRGAALASETAAERNLSLGAPQGRPRGGHFLTRGGVQVTAHVERLRFASDDVKNAPSGTSARAVEDLVDALDGRRGVLLSSSYEFPGRYARWSLGFVDPPLSVTGSGRKCSVRALNDRGTVLMPAVVRALTELYDEGALEGVDVSYEDAAQDGSGEKREPRTMGAEAMVSEPGDAGSFSEEERSRQPSLFSVVRKLVELFAYSSDDGQLGLYGAFGYDLAFQFEPIRLALERDPTQRDLVLYLPDEILVVDRDKRDSWTIGYDFCVDGKSTQGMRREGSVEPFAPYDEGSSDEGEGEFITRDTPKNEFAESVEKAKREFAVGNLFETVLSQTFREKLDSQTPPSTLFRRLRSRNPSPYGFFINLGENEYLVGASPEMFVRCERVEVDPSEVAPEYYSSGGGGTEGTTGGGGGGTLMRVETCPISGTVARGEDALEDARRVKSLMMNAKEESELTMCTDVDRNDKSRICVPGSVKVIGRRQIEMYSRLIHTVDHVEGYLLPQFDALDAFLCHTWAVTVTGAPKAWAIQFVEDHERSARLWYGGAVGMVGFDGGMNTGLTLRTVRVKDGVAEVRAGATLLYDSNPVAEELETELKASAMIDAIVQKGPEDGTDDDASSSSDASASKKTKKDLAVGKGKRLILIDHEDSFVHTLGNYLRQTGASVTTLRSGPAARKTLERMSNEGNKPDMVVLSPGPGNPTDFGLSETIDVLAKHRIPAFGVCLGLQGMVEHFGGSLGVLGYPMHGKPSQVSLTSVGKEEGSIFAGLPDAFEVARYHSLHGIKERLPSVLEVTASSDDGIVMGIRHRTLPFAAVQFHPESILTSPSHGMTILRNALECLRYDDDGETEEEEKAETSADHSPLSGADIVNDLERQTVPQLKSTLSSSGLSASGTKSELVVRLALWTHKKNERSMGRLDLEGMTVSELRELKRGMGLRGTATTKAKLISALDECLNA